MERHVDCAFIHFLIKQYYIDKRNHHNFCFCFICKSLTSLRSEMEKWSFHDLNQIHDKLFIVFHREYDCQIIIFPVFIGKNVKIHNS